MAEASKSMLRCSFLNRFGKRCPVRLGLIRRESIKRSNHVLLSIVRPNTKFKQSRHSDHLRGCRDTRLQPFEIVAFDLLSFPEKIHALSLSR